MPPRRRLVLVAALAGTLLALSGATAAHAAVTVSDARAAEGEAVRFTLRTDSLVGEVVQVATQDGTARAGEDFTAVAEAVTVPAGASGREVSVSTRPDAAVEQDESFTLVVQPQPAGAAVRARGTVLNDDDPQLVAGSVPPLTAEGDGINLAVALLAPTTRTVSVEVRTLDGTATAPADYTTTTSRVTFAPGDQVEAITVPTAEDSVFEADEVVEVRLSGATNAVAPAGTVALTIDEDDPAPRLTLQAAPAVAEGDGETPAVTGARLRLSAPAAVPVRALVATSDSGAKAGSDYEPVRRDVVFAPGETEQVVHVAIRGDTVIEKDERFFLLAAAGEHLDVPGGVAHVVLEVLNDDRDRVAPRLAVSRPVLDGQALRVRVGCPAGETRCNGRVTFFKDADRAGRDRRLRRELRLGGASFWVAGGRQRAVRLELTRRQLALLRRAGRPRVTAYAVGGDVAGNRATARSAARVRAR